MDGHAPLPPIPPTAIAPLASNVPAASGGGDARGAEPKQTFMPNHNEYVFVERHALQDNIILCDTKSGILLGFGALTILWCADHLLELASTKSSLSSMFSMAELTLQALGALMLIASLTFAWRVIKPRISAANDYIYWGSQVFLKSQAEFTTTIQNADPDRLATDMLHHLHVLAKICREKYANFRYATIAAEYAALFIFLSLGVSLVERLIEAK